MYIVGVGASAGGLDALSKFLNQFNGTKTEISVVIVMHLSPDYKSELAAILNKRCKWPVLTAENNMQIKPFQVYVTPPNHHIHIESETLVLESLSRDYTSSPSIDNFFISLSKEKQKYAIGIILSGFGSDGSQGIQSIKKHLGFTIAQLPETCEHKNMPTAAIETGKVDAALPPEQMFDEIIQFINNSKAIASSENKKSAVDAIFDLLEKRSGTDFSMYKPTTIMRRINHRIKTLQLSTILEFYELIKENPRELDILFDTVLIGVTEFFRDSEAFDSLRKQLENMLQNKEYGDSIRVWSVGCATGEEPYSIAILLHELLRQEVGHYHIQIFASDIDERAINYGRKAIYNKESLINLPKEWIDKYFDKRDELHYELNKEIKQHLLFTRHDITNDPPFVKLDLIVCRNLLIYFNNNLQKQSFQIFHYSLRPKGLLFLGKSESVSVAADLFTKVNKNKIYRKADASLGYQLKFSRFRNRNQNTQGDEHNNNTQDMSIVDIAKETLYYKFEHPFVVIDEQSEIKEVHGSLRLYLEISQGAMNVNLHKMVNPELQTVIKALHSQVKKTGISHTSHLVKFKLYEQEHYVRVKIIPLVYRISEVQFYMVIFEKIEPSERHLELHKKLETIDFENLRINELEDELSSTKEHLQVFTEELEATNEELQTINEELQSANEELKSSNEELETSNEELQSANEELNTANNELRLTNELMIEKEEELKAEKNISEKNELIYRTIAENIPNGTVGILNDKFEIEYVAGQGLDQLEADEIVGKYMPGINPSKEEEKRLHKLCADTLQKGSGRLGVSYNDRFYEIKTELFNFSFDDGEKILYLVQEVTETKRSKRILETALEAAELIVFEYNFEEDSYRNNKGLCEFLGYPSNKKLTENDLVAKIHPEDIIIRKRSLKKAVKTGNIYHELRLIVKNITKHVRVKGKIIFDENNVPLIAVASIFNITKDKKLLYRIQESEQRFKTIASAAPLTIWITDKDKNCTYINETWLNYTGSKLEDNLGDKWLNFLHPEDKEKAMALFADASNKRQPYSMEYRVKKHDGTHEWYYNRGIPIYDDDNNFQGLIGSNVNINDKVEFTNELEKRVFERTKELTEANQELTRLNMNLEEFAYMASHDLKEPLRKIRTFNSLLESNAADKEAFVLYTEKIEKSAERMTDLINNILEYSRIEKKVAKRETVNLDELLEEVIFDLSVLIEEEKVKIEIDALGDIQGAPVRIYQLFSNLIRNGIKFNKEVPEIEIYAKIIKGGMLPKRLNANKKLAFKLITFKDNGIGLDTAKRDYIFKPFKRLNSRSEYAGTGIGLAICKRIMDLHEGYIDVESTEDKGAEFKVYFPIIE
ncbi:CheR family methyltransferase [Aquimarina sp. M1]